MLAKGRYVGVALNAMSEKHQPKSPFGDLGNKLRRLRINRKESLAEVSGAVEIDIDMLQNIEQGKARPNEDILLLLISHFELKDKEADTLWRLAGYNDDPSQFRNETVSEKQMIAVTPDDLKIVYTDLVHITANDFGVILNFLQSGGPGNQPLAISRVGMSREHAQVVLELLHKTLAENQQKALPEPEEKNVKN